MWVTCDFVCGTFCEVKPSRQHYVAQYLAKHSRAFRILKSLEKKYFKKKKFSSSTSLRALEALWKLEYLCNRLQSDKLHRLFRATIFFFVNRFHIPIIIAIIDLTWKFEYLVFADLHNHLHFAVNSIFRKCLMIISARISTYDDF